jgi:hypothetical protein
MSQAGPGVKAEDKGFRQNGPPCAVTAVTDSDPLIRDTGRAASGGISRSRCKGICQRLTLEIPVGYFFLTCVSPRRQTLRRVTDKVTLRSKRTESCSNFPSFAVLM